MHLGDRTTPPAPSADWAYFLDVDGSLIDIADTPDAVCFDAALLDLLAQAHWASRGAIALVSGRALADLACRLGMPHLPLSGQHGLERRDAAGRLSIHAPRPAVMNTLKDNLAPILLRHPGLLLEDKGLSMALHYRRAPHLAAYAHGLMRRLASTASLEVQYGKCVVEIKPAGVDKGTAIADYLNEAPFYLRLPVFIGDDQSDERGFAEVNRRGGVSIKVGRGASCACFRLPDAAATRRWLSGLAIARPA